MCPTLLLSPRCRHKYHTYKGAQFLKSETVGPPGDWKKSTPRPKREKKKKEKKRTKKKEQWVKMILAGVYKLLNR